ncbi:MAG: hypothetical protein HKN18_00395, partial [Silicimonas sp.]|nr:hypothetical protein [Silicimonas sp.]
MDEPNANIHRKAASLLDREARKSFRAVIVISCVSALLSAAMIWSVMPFLIVLSDPNALQDSRVLSRIHSIFGEPSQSVFLIYLGLFTIALVLLAGAASLLNTLSLARFTSSINHNLCRRLLRLYLFKPYDFHIDRNSGELSSVLLSEVQTAVQEYFRPVAELVSSLLTASAVFCVLALVEFKITIAAAVLIGGTYGVIYSIIRKYVVQIGAQRVTANAERFRTANEGLQGIKEIVVFGREYFFLSKFDRASAAVHSATLVLRVLAELPRNIIQTLIFSATIAFCIFYVSSVSPDANQGASGLIPMIGIFGGAAQRLVPELQKLYGGFTT